MKITHLIPLMTALTLCGCFSNVNPTKPSDFGETVTLAPDCHEIAGTYTNIFVFTTNQDIDAQGTFTLEMFFEKKNVPPDLLIKPESITIHFPEKGMLKILKTSPDGGVLNTKTLLESNGEFECSNGVLNMNYKDSDMKVKDISLYQSNTQTRSFTITTKKYLQVQVSTNSFAAIFLMFIPILGADQKSDWYYYAPK